MTLEELVHCSSVANVEVVMFVSANIRNQIVADFFRGSFRAKKLFSHIIVDPDHARALACKTFNRFRAD